MAIFRFAGIELEEAPEAVVPVCPHCKAELRRLWCKSRGLGGVAQKQILLCPECRAFLGYAMEVT
jgi:hypothetical protein